MIKIKMTLSKMTIVTGYTFLLSLLLLLSIVSLKSILSSHVIDNIGNEFMFIKFILTITDFIEKSKK